MIRRKMKKFENIQRNENSGQPKMLLQTTEQNKNDCNAKVKVLLDMYTNMFVLLLISLLFPNQPRNLDHTCKTTTKAIKTKLKTITDVGPTLKPGASSLYSRAEK